MNLNPKPILINLIIIWIVLQIQSILLESYLNFLIHDTNIFISICIFFFLNTAFYLVKLNFKLFFYINVIIYLYLTTFTISKVFYLNYFEMISRYNYFKFFDFIYTVKIIIFICIVFLIVFIFSYLQRFLYKKYLDFTGYNIQISLITLFLIIAIIRPSFVYKNVFKYQASYFGFGHELVRDYNDFFNDLPFSQFPGVTLSSKYLSNHNDKKQLLLILESWGKLKSGNDILCSEYISYVEGKYPELFNKYKLIFDSTSYYGSSVGA